MTTPLWTAYSDCPKHIKSELKARVRSFPASFLLPLIAGEVFENPDTCQERLRGWALSKGFAIVQKSDSLKQAHPRSNFHYIHHRDDIANTRKLEKHVKRDEENRITSHHNVTVPFRIGKVSRIT
jgi:hypothetical protein